MNSSRLFADPSAFLVADASVIINLNGSGKAAEFLRALPHRVVVTENALAELENGRKDGHQDAALLHSLIDQGLVSRESVFGAGAGVYEDLVRGPAIQTLDDGEAATISYALVVNGIAVIDERKAWSICTTKYPEVSLVSTVELLLHPEMLLRLGEGVVADAMFSALQVARMRVPREHIDAVRDIVGPDRIALCSSLPKAVRQGGI